MMEKSDSKSLLPGQSYFLEVKIPDQHPTRREIQGQILAGLDPRNDVILVDPKIKSKHFHFKTKEKVLTVHFLGKTGETFLNGLPLEKEKLYLLEKGDVITVGKVEIIIKTGAQTRKHIEERPLFSEMPPPLPVSLFSATEETTPAPKADIKMSSTSPTKEITDWARAWSLVPYKIYGFMLDVALTYFVLAFVFPRTHLLSSCLDFLYPISKYGLQTLGDDYGPSKASSLVALIEFFVCFHLLMISSALIIGRTPGALILGLRPKEKNHPLTLRFKTYLYTLLNVFALPLIVFDVPLFKGKNIKEILTLTSFELTNTAGSGTCRRVIAPVIILLSFLSPLFLGPPYNADITELKIQLPKYVDTHTTVINTISRELGLSIKTEINQNFAVLPFFGPSQIGLALYDLRTQEAVFLKEERRISLERSFFDLRYANPLMGLFMPLSGPDNEVLKSKSVMSLRLNLNHLFLGLSKFGPFMANGLLFKEEFIQTNDRGAQFLLHSFGEKNPLLLISQVKNKGATKVFLFTRKNIIEFNLIASKNGRLDEALLQTILAPMQFDQGLPRTQLEPGILDAWDAFERSNYQTLLTYYANEAKKAQSRKDPEWKTTLVKNIEQTKMSLFSDPSRVRLNKTIERSFDDILKTLNGHGQR